MSQIDQTDQTGQTDQTDQTGMLFNAGKFELLRFWQDRDAAPDILYMAPDGGPIEEKDSLRDLGVRISTDLSFSDQVDLTVESGNRMAGWNSGPSGEGTGS